jgi:hypothetical protein
MQVNEDGTQVIELTRPKDGPMGFYLAKGNAQYKLGKDTSSSEFINHPFFVF